MVVVACIGSSPFTATQITKLALGLLWLLLKSPSWWSVKMSFLGGGFTLFSMVFLPWQEVNKLFVDDFQHTICNAWYKLQEMFICHFCMCHHYTDFNLSWCDTVQFLRGHTLPNVPCCSGGIHIQEEFWRLFAFCKEVLNENTNQSMALLKKCRYFRTYLCLYNN